MKLIPSQAGIYSLLIMFLLPVATARASEPCIAVYYPDVPAPYRSTFRDIISGISDSGMWIPEAIAIDEATDISTQQEAASDPVCQAQIGLGRVGVNYLTSPLMSRVDRQIPTVFGAIQAPLGEKAKVATISLAPDPHQVLRRLRHFAPAIHNVHIVFNVGISHSFVKIASRAAEELGLNLISHETDEIENSLNLYRQLLLGLNPQTDAVWMISDHSAPQIKAVLPIVLKTAWKRNIVVFSSQPTHAKRGVLFSICPDYRALGIQLARLAYRCSQQPHSCKDQTIAPLTSIKTAINTKTASRLKLALDYENDPYIDLFFPEKSP